MCSLIDCLDKVRLYNDGRLKHVRPFGPYFPLSISTFKPTSLLSQVSIFVSRMLKATFENQCCQRSHTLRLQSSARRHQEKGIGVKSMCLISLFTRDIASASTSIVQSKLHTRWVCYSLPDLFVKTNVDPCPHVFCLGKVKVFFNIFHLFPFSQLCSPFLQSTLQTLRLRVEIPFGCRPFHLRIFHCGSF